MSTGDSPRLPILGVNAEWAKERRKALGETYARLTGKPDIVSETEIDGIPVRLIPWPHEWLETALEGDGWAVIGHGGTYRRWQYGNDAGPMVIVPLNPDYGDYGELIEHAEITRRNVAAGQDAAVPDYYPATIAVTPKMADELKRRWWREPAETIDTIEQLQALPNGTALRDAHKRIAEIKDWGYEGSNRFITWTGTDLTEDLDGDYLSAGDILPAIVLWKPESEQ